MSGRHWRSVKQLVRDRASSHDDEYIATALDFLPGSISLAVKLLVHDCLPPTSDDPSSAGFRRTWRQVLKDTQ